MAVERTTRGLYGCARLHAWLDTICLSKITVWCDRDLRAAIGLDSSMM